MRCIKHQGQPRRPTKALIKLNMMNKSSLSKHPVLIFFILTFVISWGAILLLFGFEAIPATKEMQEKIGMAILLGPTLSGILLIMLHDGLSGIRQLGSRLVHWRANIRWYLVAVFTAPLSTLLCVLIFSLFTSAYHPPVLNSNDPSGILLLGIIGGLTIGLFEEIGWTGFAIPRLLRKLNIFKTGMLLGLIWGAWHFILFWENDSFHRTIPFLLLLARLFSWLPAYRILMVWVYEGTKSLLIIILMHASLVASLAILDPLVSGKDLLIYIVIRAAVLWSIVAVMAIFRNRAKRNSIVV